MSKVARKHFHGQQSPNPCGRQPHSKLPGGFRNDPEPPPYPGTYSLEDQAVFAINTLAVVGTWLCDIKTPVADKDLQAAGALLMGVREFLETLDLPATAEGCQQLAAVHAEKIKQLRRSRT